ncbi:MAG: sensor histidine kinase [Actinobacteria bacterium]|nr:sensor histidine kinase [Actinomycetota bacterium]
MSLATAARERLGALRATGERYLGVVDVLVAAALTVGGLVEVVSLIYTAPVALAVASCVVSTGSVALRRLAPFTVAVVATAAMTVYEIATHDPDGSFMAPAAVLVYYYAGRSAAERRAWTRLATLLGVALVVSPLIDTALGGSSLLSALSGWPLTVVPIAAGLVVARQTALVRRLAATTASLQAEQRVRAQRLLSEERNRVARELHDVVAHHVSVMVIQAGGARLVAETHTAAADAALRVVERSGREALADLRRIMGVMRRSDAPGADTSVGLAHVDQIVARARAGGVRVDVEVRGRLDRVPAAIDLVAYRVVQEAVTNVVKHARPATARVTISVDEQALDVSVIDDGAPPVTPGLPGSGQGLIGMRERVALYGGQLTSRKRAGGGFEVRAAIPLRSEPLDLSGVMVTLGSAPTVVHDEQHWRSGGWLQPDRGRMWRWPDVGWSHSRSMRSPTSTGAAR